MILLDNVYFDTVALSERPSLAEFASYKWSTTGKIIRTKAQVVTNERSYTLNVDVAKRLQLEFLLADSLTPIDFVDDQGFSWIVVNGSDDSSHAYNTGAYFKPPTKLSYTPNDGRSTYCGMNWNVDVVILVNAAGVRSENEV